MHSQRRAQRRAAREGNVANQEPCPRHETADGAHGADDAAFALAAMQQSNPQDAIRLLAAASAKANMDNQQLQQQQILTSNHAAHALTTAGLASEGVDNSDATCDGRNKRQNAINEQVDLSLQHQDSVNQHLNSTNQQQQQLIEALQARTARLEAMLGRVLTMFFNNNVDANQIAEILRELNL